MAALNVITVGGVVSFVYFFTNVSVDMRTALAAMAMAWCSAFTVVILVAPKLYMAWFMSDEAVKNIALGVPDTSHDTPGQASRHPQLRQLRTAPVSIQAGSVASGSGRAQSSPKRGLGLVRWDMSAVAALRSGRRRSPQRPNGGVGVGGNAHPSQIASRALSRIVSGIAPDGLSPDPSSRSERAGASNGAFNGGTQGTSGGTGGGASGGVGASGDAVPLSNVNLVVSHDPTSFVVDKKRENS